MKRFVIKGALFSVIILLSFTLLVRIGEAGLKKTQAWKFVVNTIYSGDIQADLILLGASRAEVHFSPLIIDSVLHTNSYNIGVGATDWIGQIALFNIYKNRNGKPKYVIHSADDFLEKTEKLTYCLTYLPYISDPVVAGMLRKYDDLAWYDYYNPLTKYWQQRNIVIGWVEMLGYHLFEPNYKGYVEQDITWDNSFEAFQASHPQGLKREINDEISAAIREYISQLGKDNIKIALVYSPQYIEYQRMVINREEILGYWRTIADEFDVLFLDYTQDAISYNRDLFYNSQHLNKTGAEIFSRKLAEDLKELNFIDGR